MDWYGGLLLAHGAWRWAVFGLGAAALLYVVWAYATRAQWSRLSRGLSTGFVGALDGQLALGLALYLFASPLTRPSSQAFTPTGETLFFQFIHFFAMIIAIAVAHAGRVFAMRAPQDRGKHARLAIAFAVVLAIILAATPWQRPVLRGVL